MSKYLFGASVQGIQDFIFKTNQLKEIVGASEIVKGIADEFTKEVDGIKHSILLNAAGSIKAIFESKSDLEKIVRDFPKSIMQKAYGVTVSQAVVEMSGEFSSLDSAINELEKRLRIQRSRASLPLDKSISILKLASRTAKPLYRIDKDDLDISSVQKRDANDKFLKDNPRNKEFKNISDFSNGKNKIAVIHIDGNGLGQIVPKLGDKLSAFSINLDNATKGAFDEARDESMDIREVILGGDDVTVICNADNALDFTKKFLHLFEDKTSKIAELKNIGASKLTACAGIVYCHEKYPFHYAANLAEALCGVAKRHSKALVDDNTPAPSSLMFHNIQSSNFQSWEKFVADELTITNDQQSIACDFGAYYLDQDDQPNIENLQICIESYKQEGSPISRLREWIGELGKSHQYASDLLERINDVIPRKGKWNTEIMDKNLKNLYKSLDSRNLIVEKDGKSKTPIYDILQILSATGGAK